MVDPCGSAAGPESAQRAGKNLRIANPLPAAGEPRRPNPPHHRSQVASAEPATTAKGPEVGRVELPAQPPRWTLGRPHGIDAPHIPPTATGTRRARHVRGPRHPPRPGPVVDPDGATAGAPGARLERDGVRRGATTGRAARRIQQHRTRRHVALGRPHLDHPVRRDPADAALPRHGLRRSPATRGALRRPERRHLPDGDHDLERHQLDRDDHHRAPRWPLQTRDGLRRRAPTHRAVWRRASATCSARAAA